MCTFYRGTIESILTSCITVWYGACNASCCKSLQRIVRAAEKNVGVSLPSLQDIYSTRLSRKALCIAGDTTHPTHSFFSLLPSGRRLRSLQARTNRLKDIFIHQAVRKLNSLPSFPPLPSLTPLNSDLFGLIKKIFFGCVSLSGDMSCVGVDRSRTITIFCCSVRPMFSVMCGLSCSCFYVVFVCYNQGLKTKKKIQSVHSEQNRYFNVSVPVFLMYYYRSETG